MRELLVVALIVCCGCSASPWKAGTAAAGVAAAGSLTAAPNSSAGAGGATASGPASAATPAATPSPAVSRAATTQKPDPKEVDELVAQLSLDAAGKAKLTEDLMRTDPALWPAVKQSFQATLAYQRQSERRGAVAAAVSKPSTSDTAAEDAAPPPAADSAPARGRSRQKTTPAPEANLAAERTASQAPSPAPSNSLPGPEPSGPESRSERRDGLPRRLAASDDRVPARLSAAGTGKKSEKLPAKSNERANSREADDEADVVAAAYVAPAAAGSDHWQDHLAAAIKSLEAELRQSTPTSNDAARQARLRLLCIAADRRSEALRPIPSISPTVQDFWSQELYGLAAWLDTDRTTDPSRRAAEAQRQLAGAVSRLGELAPLAIRNLTFIKAVNSYGDYEPIEKCEFAPGQEVLLYAEVDNFKSEETPKGFSTELHGSYEIFDAAGKRVIGRELTKTAERCRNQRRDFFVGYQFRLPKQLIYPGKHTLQLTVEDLKSQKIGQSSVEFSIKGAAD
jgi:hypothetical protein